MNTFACRCLSICLATPLSCRLQRSRNSGRHLPDRRIPSSSKI